MGSVRFVGPLYTLAAHSHPTPTPEMNKALAVLTLLGPGALVQAADNGKAITPPLGWCVCRSTDQADTRVARSAIASDHRSSCRAPLPRMQALVEPVRRFVFPRGQLGAFILVSAARCPRRVPRHRHRTRPVPCFAIRHAGNVNQDLMVGIMAGMVARVHSVNGVPTSLKVRTPLATSSWSNASA